MSGPGERIAVLAPLGRDAEMLSGALRDAGLEPWTCGGLEEAAAGLLSAGTLLVTEEALGGQGLDALRRQLDEQPPWSDVPVVVLTRGGRPTEPVPSVLAAFHRLGNVTLLERPVRVMTLVSAVESALRARRRQYEVRDHLAERARHEQELQARAEQVAAESRAKDEFLAMLGHELRNPLGAIAAASHLLDVAAPVTDDDAAAPARRVIARQLRHITRLVDDLLDVSRVTTGKIELARRPLDAAHAVANCVAALRGGALAGDRIIEVTTRPAWVDADEVRFDQIVNNLLLNAVKYTRAGGRIDVEAGPEGADFVLRVRDDGIGIAPDLLPRVFDVFVQGGPAIERTQGGLGIGLTLVRRLVEMHGGTVAAASDGAGRGSAFTVRLPALATPAAPAPAPPVPPARGGRRVLVVEDHDDARQMMALMLKDAGHEVLEAADGPGALALARREPLDAAIVDVGLPGIDGYEVAARLRAAPATRHLLLVALTGYGQPEDRQRASEAGFDEHLVKPVEFARLARLLSPAS